MSAGLKDRNGVPLVAARLHLMVGDMAEIRAGLTRKRILPELADRLDLWCRIGIEALDELDPEGMKRLRDARREKTPT